MGTVNRMSGPKSRMNKILKRILRHKVLYLFVLPSVIWLLIFCYWPMYGVVLAFKNYRYDRGIIGSSWAGLKWFKVFCSSPDFWIVTKNTLIISGMKLLLCFPAPIFLSLLLNEVTNVKFKRVVQTASYLPNFVSWVVVVHLTVIIFSPYGGIVNNIREAMGLPVVFFMGEKNTFYPMVILSDIWKNAGWGSIIYLSALSGVNMDLYEAAAIDGAGKMQCVWHITLPGIKGTIGVMFIFAVGNLLNAGFDQILLLQQPANREISQILDTYVIEKGLQYAKFELATAVGVFKSVFSLVMMAITNYS